MFQDKEYKWGNECSNRPSKTANLPLARCHYAAYSCRTSIPCSYANGGSFWSGGFMAPCQLSICRCVLLCAVGKYHTRWGSLCSYGYFVRWGRYMTLWGGVSSLRCWALPFLVSCTARGVLWSRRVFRLFGTPPLSHVPMTGPSLAAAQKAGRKIRWEAGTAVYFCLPLRSNLRPFVTRQRSVVVVGIVFRCRGAAP